MQSSRPATESTAVPWLRRLFRPKFSLRTLLLGMALVGVGLGLFHRLDQTRQLVVRIEAAGGRCGYKDRESSGRFETWVRERLPRSYFDEVTDVCFDGNREKLDRLLADLAGLNSLKLLNLNDTQVSDAELKYLAELKSLKSLSLDNTQFGDAGLAHLAGLKSLEYLWLNNTPVSDAGVSHLVELKSLKYLWLNATHVSEAGFQQIHTALPDCLVYGQ